MMGIYLFPDEYRTIYFNIHKAKSNGYMFCNFAYNLLSLFYFFISCLQNDLVLLLSLLASSIVYLNCIHPSVWFVIINFFFVAVVFSISSSSVISPFSEEYFESFYWIITNVLINSFFILSLTDINFHLILA